MISAVLVASLMLTGAEQIDQSQVLARNPVSVELARLFVSVCVKGEARFPAEKIVEAKPSQTYGYPYFRPPANTTSRLYMIDVPARAYIHVVDYSSNDSEGKRISCSLSSGGTDVYAAMLTILRGLEMRPIAKPVGAIYRYEIVVPERNFRMIVLSKYFLVTIYNDATSAKMLVEQSKLKMPYVRALKEYP